jgi:GMP synthase (glutamine-hydrolysing)
LSAGGPPAWEDPYASPAVPRVQAKRESDARVTKPALIITHLPDRKSGLVREAIEHAGYPIREQNVFDGTPLPPIDRVGAIVSLGGKMSATRVEEDEYLTAEVSLLQAAVTNGVPTLGICLGAQLLAVAAGGDVVTMPRVYVGWPQLSLTVTGDDRVFGDLSSGTRVLKWHEDRIEPPPGAAVLATTASPGAALFRVGSAAWGSQMHIEVTPEMLLQTWLADPDEVAEIESGGHQIADFRQESADRLPAQMDALRPVLARFASLVTEATHDHADA